jgi:hypothetical protein
MTQIDSVPIAAVIIGFVVSVKPGGIESCNCWAEQVK